MTGYRYIETVDWSAAWSAAWSGNTAPHSFPREKLLLALIDAASSDSKITQASESSTSPELAKTTKAINASSSSHKEQPLEPSKQPIKNRRESNKNRRKPISKFRLMDLPQELRRTILIFAMPDQAKDGASWRSDFWEIEEPRGDPGFLSATTRMNNERLRLETILVTLQEGLINVDCRTQALGHWLISIDFGLLRQAGTTSLQNGLGALRAVRVCAGIGHQFESTGALLSRLPNLQELVIQRTDWFVLARMWRA